MVAHRPIGIVLPSMSLLLALVPGCLERKETVRVARDGSVALTVQIKGDPADFATGDMLPDQSSGWQSRDEITTDDKGKQTQHREASLRVAAGRPLPDSYAQPHDPNYLTALSFPTEVEIERRQDGTYYHFRRVYLAREQARYDYYRQALEDAGVFKKVSGKDPAELSDEERAELIGALRTLEALKRTEFVRAGVEAAGEHWPQDYGLRLRQTVLETFAAADLGPVLDLLKQPQSPERDAAIDEYGRRLIEGVRESLERTLRDLHVRTSERQALFLGYDQEEARRAVTEDLADETWEVRVALPGQIVAHNADKLEDGLAIWKFPGKALMDRDQVLMVTSRVARDAEAEAEERQTTGDE